jgi:hypothetical protein
VQRVDIKQRPLEQRPAPSAHLVPQGLPIRPAHAPLLRIGYARHVEYVRLEHEEVLPAQSQQIRAALHVSRDPHSAQRRMPLPVQPALLLV